LSARIPALAALVVLLTPRVASADGAPSVDVRTWAPSADPAASLVLEPASTPGPWAFAASAWTHYENDSVVLRAPSTGSVASRPLENQLGTDLLASLGLGQRAEVGVRVPTFLYEQGSGGQLTSVVASGKVPTSGFGDLALVGKGTLIANELGGVGLATLGELTLPTGASTGFLGDSGATVTVRMLADVSLLVASLQASIGYRLRTIHVAWPQGTVGGATFGDEIPWTVGLLVRPAILHAIDPGGRQSWEVALHGSLPAGPVAPFGLGGGGSSALSPVLLALSDRVGLGRYRDAFVLAGLDVGLDHAIGVPSVRGTIALGFRFEGHDRDGDGIADDADQCPGIAEDHDGFEDADGCPEADNDQDGIVDAEDACPNVAGAPSPDPRKNGCP
jgi:OOP family OmpA-OmpF porin